jgi:hypothetical protein
VIAQAKPSTSNHSHPIIATAIAVRYISLKTRERKGHLVEKPETSMIEIEQSDAAEAPLHSAPKAASLLSWL